MNVRNLINGGQKDDRPSVFKRYPTSVIKLIRGQTFFRRQKEAAERISNIFSAPNN